MRRVAEFGSLGIIRAMTPEPHQDLPEANERQLCVSCMTPNDPAAHFCTKCGAPLSSYASTGPFESLFAEGSVYRSAAERPRKLVVVLGVWLIFGMMTLAGVLLVVIGRDTGFVYTISGAVMLAIAPVMIWKTTRSPSVQLASGIAPKSFQGEKDVTALLAPVQAIEVGV